MQFFVDALVGKTDIRPVYDAIASAHCHKMWSKSAVLPSGGIIQKILNE